MIRASVGAAACAVALPLVPTVSACGLDEEGGGPDYCRASVAPVHAPGPAAFEPWWVATFLPTRVWATPFELERPLADVASGRLFRVDGPQDGYRLPVWDPRRNEHVFIGSEAVGPADPPFWAALSDDGRWIDVNLTPMQHLRAMQGDEEIFRDLVTAGLQGTTKPGAYRIVRRVENETMDSRTVPNSTDTYLLKDVKFTQYFTGDGAAIHYNYWGPPRGFGYPGSHGCLGMRYDGSKYMWDWASIGTPLLIHY
jgi:hypothetical protein